MATTRSMLRVVLFALLCMGVAVADAAAPRPVQVLFVGNSLTYVGNLPAVLEALAADNGKSLQADMLVKGGATLTQWLESGAVQRALQAGHYDYVVLQERGNDFACGFGPRVCKDSRHALHALAKIVRHTGARPVLMGTYQIGHDASEALVAAESEAAGADAVPYLAVSERLNIGRERIPYDDWFAKAGHPGHDLVLLEAVLLYQHLYGAPPPAKALAVRAPMFVPGSKFAPPSPVSVPLLPELALAGGYDYSRDEMATAIELAR
ncbi:MAG TPA: SGNH/GDSL hydrolase family protein [Rhodanobacteraceae bacterium]|nr:SGNH/GDSL hydrolase family protein [Rhodanobacteraceae bacterium]